MRVILTILLLTFSHSVLAQAPTQKEYVASSLTPMYEKHNISSVPQGFEDCAYNAFLKHADKNDDGFTAGRETITTCFPKFVDEITFSDNGRRIKRLFLPYFEGSCLNENIRYEDQMDVEGYCGCLSEKYRDDNMPVSRIFDPSFARSEEYQSLALQCAKSNRY